MTHIFIPRILAGGSLIGQPDLQSKFQASQSYIVRLCLNKEKEKKKEKNKEEKKFIHVYWYLTPPPPILKESRITCLGNDAAYSGLNLPMVIDIINIYTH